MNQQTNEWWNGTELIRKISSGDKRIAMETIRQLVAEAERRTWEEARELIWQEKEEIGPQIDNAKDDRSKLILLAEDTGLDIALDAIDAKIKGLK